MKRGVDMKKRIMLVGLFLLMLMPLAVIAMAQELEVNVVRYGSDLYEISGQDLFIQTDGCYEGSERADIFLKLDDSGDRIQFKKSGNSCDIGMVYGRSQLDPGDYKFSVSRADEGWYEIDGQDGAFKTTGCYSLVENVDVRVFMQDGGHGTLAILTENEECRIDGVYGKAELKIVVE
jgi:hypothetical protein